ncbi:MAG: glycosyltransferase family 2 protein [Candidatus Moraniibacteriota bacterium]
MNNNFKLSVVVPIFNEEPNILELNGRLTKALATIENYEVIFVDDGSKDKTLSLIKKLSVENEKIKYLSFSRNFGHQNALRAGLAYASGDCVVSMDGDLQHPPELIPKLVEKWQEGFKIVYTVRQDSQKLSFFKKGTAKLFYALMAKLSDVNIPRGAADFRLLDRQIVEIILKIEENTFFLRGLVAWLGFDQFAIEYAPEERFAGKTKYSLKKMISFAITGITSFSVKPLRLATVVGFVIAFLAFLYAIYALYVKIFTDSALSGWTSVLVSVLFLSGIQLITFGIMGEYIGKLFMQAKGRPNYIIKEKNCD